MSQQLLVVHVDRGWAWGVVIAAFIANFVIGGLAKSFGIVMTEFKELFDCPSAYMTLAGGLIYTFMYITSILVHVISNRIGPRIVLAVGSFGATLSVVGASVVESVALWIALIGVGLGISLSCIYFSAFVVVGQCFDRYLGLANGVSVAGVSVGQIVFPIIVPYLIEKYTIRGATLIAGGVVFHLLIASVLMPSIIVRPQKDEVTSQQQTSDSTRDTDLTGDLDGDVPAQKEKQKRRSVARMDWTLFLIFTGAKICSDVGDVGLSIVIPPRGKELGLTNTIVGYAIMTGGLVDLFSRLLIGYLADHKKCKRSLILLVAWVVEAANGMAVAHVASVSGFVTCYGVYGVCSGTAMALMVVVLTDFVGVHHLPRAFAMMMVGIGVNLAPGQFLLGYIKDRTGSYSWSIILASVLVLVGALLLAFEYPIRILRRRRSSDSSRANQELAPMADEPEDEGEAKAEFHTSRTSLHAITNATATADLL